MVTVSDVALMVKKLSPSGLLMLAATVWNPVGRTRAMTVLEAQVVPPFLLLLVVLLPCLALPTRRLVLLTQTTRRLEVVLAAPVLSRMLMSSRRSSECAGRTRPTSSNISRASPRRLRVDSFPLSVMMLVKMWASANHLSMCTHVEVIIP